MPVYEYYCKECDANFDEVLPMARFDEPCEQPCPECSAENAIHRGVSVSQMGVDAKVTPDSRTGGQFSELMSRMKSGMPKRYRDNLDVASSRTGKRMGPI
jgi:putative FmdB family regulatory protein